MPLEPIDPNPPPRSWAFSAPQWLLMVAVGAAALVAFGPGLRFMWHTWQQVEEYSHGMFIPLVAAFLVWQRSDRLRAEPLRGAASGLALVVLGLVMGLVGEWSAVRVIGQYGFVLAVAGATVCTIGWRGARLLALPLLLLLLMVPLPQFVLAELSQRLQLWSSQLGVALIRAFSISVFLEGNVIDLGSYKLQVADACSGLRYLFPLTVLGCLAAYLFDAPMWQRVWLVVSTVPLTIGINSLRIGLVGVTVEYWGADMAEGLLHDFEGWFVFMVCLALLLLQMVLLARLQPGPRRPLRDVIGIDLPAPAEPGVAAQQRRTPWPLLAAGAAFVLAAGLLFGRPAARADVPPREPLAGFPRELPGGFVGRDERLDPEVLATLAVNDHLHVNYQRPGEPPVNVFVAWYASQGGGQSSHSPRTCLPGGGWRIASLQRTPVAAPGAGATMVVNRAVIERGGQRQLVYYWFDQRGKVLTDELEVKWSILRDGLVMGRSDGALLRLVTAVSEHETLADADARLNAISASAMPPLRRHIPGQPVS